MLRLTSHAVLCYTPSPLMPGLHPIAPPHRAPAAAMAGGRSAAPLQQPSSSSTSCSVTPQDVLSSLMNDGTFDSLRAKIINQLKHNEELRKYTTLKVEQSQVLNTPGAEQKTKRELFEALRRELEGPVLDKASKAAWDIILSKEGVGKEIGDTVYRAYNELTNKDPSVYSPSDPHTSLAANADESARNHNFTMSYANGHMHSVNPALINVPRSGDE